MKCPYCEWEMVPGEAYVKATKQSFLLVGLSWQYLWFKRDVDGKGEPILSGWSDDSRAGHRCPACGAVLIQGRPAVAQSDAERKKERTCDNCGCVTTGNAKTCAYCGADLG